jgi:hypothetical protein
MIRRCAFVRFRDDVPETERGTEGLMVIDLEVTQM